MIKRIVSFVLTVIFVLSGASFAFSASANKDENCDVVIIGGGGAGMSAALNLKKAGKNVILVEKMGIMGGTTLTASTWYSAYNTKIHKAKGIVASEDLANAICGPLMKKDKATADEFLDAATYMADWFIDLGADMSRLIDGKWQMGPQDGGTIGGVIVPVMIKELKALKVDYRTGTKALSIIEKDGAVRGIVVENKSGKYNINAKAVIIASGGHLANKEMVKQYSPQWAKYDTTWSAGSTGDGLIMAQKLGATLSNMDKILINPTGYRVKGMATGMLSFSPFRYNGCILVGRSTGKRFADELAHYTAIALAMPEGKGYAIVDQGMVDSISTIKKYRDSGYFVKGNTIEELAIALKLDPAVLRNTMETYTSYAKSGVDKEFGRKIMLSTLTTPPYYAAPVEPALHNPTGGITVNTRAQVLRADGSIIPDLYAIGNVADNLVIPTTVAGVIGYGKLVADQIIKDLK